MHTGKIKKKNPKFFVNYTMANSWQAANESPLIEFVDNILCMSVLQTYKVYLLKI